MEFRKRKGRKKSCENREHLARLYAPPSYEVVIGTNDEEPPPYQSVADDTDTSSEVEESDTDSVGDKLTESRDSQISNVHLLPKCVESNSLPHSNVNVTSAVVVCDIDGNHQVLCKTGRSIDTSQDSTDSFQELTNLHVCSTGAPCHPNFSNLKVVVRGASNLLDDINEIEVLPTADTPGSPHTNGRIKSNSNSKKTNLNLGKGRNLNQNGLSEKSNGHAIKYKRSPSQIEAIQFIDSD